MRYGLIRGVEAPARTPNALSASAKAEATSRLIERGGGSGLGTKAIAPWIVGTRWPGLSLVKSEGFNYKSALILISGPFEILFRFRNQNRNYGKSLILNNLYIDISAFFATR